MNRHPTDAELLDALAPGAEPSAALRAHFESCPECRARLEADRPLTERIAALPAESDPPRDLWPDVRARIEAEPRDPARGAPRTVRRIPDWLRAAAAVALFVAGAAVGRALAPGAPSSPTPRDPLSAAAEVQRAGTAYVAAVARFRAAASDAPGATVGQARDVALAAVYGAAWELERMRPDDATARGIVALAGDDGVAEVSP